MRIVAVLNQKGGTAKTTTAVNVAACLTTRRQKVLLPKRECFMDRGEPLRSLGVSTGRLVSQEARILDDGDGRAGVFVCGSHGRAAYPSTPRPASTPRMGARS